MDNDSDSRSLTSVLHTQRKKVGRRWTTLPPKWNPYRDDSYDPGTSRNGTEHSITKVWPSPFGSSVLRWRGAGWVKCLVIQGSHPHSESFFTRQNGWGSRSRYRVFKTEHPLRPVFVFRDLQKGLLDWSKRCLTSLQGQLSTRVFVTSHTTFRPLTL